jgi:hypothetical protein
VTALALHGGRGAEKSRSGEVWNQVLSASASRMLALTSTWLEFRLLRLLPSNLGALDGHAGLRSVTLLEGSQTRVFHFPRIHAGNATALLI